MDLSLWKKMFGILIRLIRHHAIPRDIIVVSKNIQLDTHVLQVIGPDNTQR